MSAFLWRISDSNRPPSDCEPDALPDELIPQMRCKNNGEWTIDNGQWIINNGQSVGVTGNDSTYRCKICVLSKKIASTNR